MYLGIAALALGRAAEVIDDDAGSSGAKEDGISPSQATPGAGDDDGLAVEAELLSHCRLQKNLITNETSGRWKR